MMAVAEGQKCNGTCILLDTMALGGRRTDGSNTALCMLCLLTRDKNSSTKFLHSDPDPVISKI